VEDVGDINTAPIVKLGEGGFGKILLAECVMSREKVAVKVRILP
jgi:hypothetical protein